MRKFANTPLHITEEVVGLLLSVTLFLGLPIVTFSHQARAGFTFNHLRKWDNENRVTNRRTGRRYRVFLGG